MLGFLNPSLEEKEWNTAQSKKLWLLMPIVLGGVMFVGPVFMFVHNFFWGVLIANILMRVWIHKAFETQNFKNVLLYKLADSITFGLIIGYAMKVLAFTFIGGAET